MLLITYIAHAYACKTISAYYDSIAPICHILFLLLSSATVHALVYKLKTPLGNSREE